MNQARGRQSIAAVITFAAMGVVAVYVFVLRPHPAEVRAQSVPQFTEIQLDLPKYEMTTTAYPRESDRERPVSRSPIDETDHESTPAVNDEGDASTDDNQSEIP